VEGGVITLPKEAYEWPDLGIESSRSFVRREAQYEGHSNVSGNHDGSGAAYGAGDHGRSDGTTSHGVSGSTLAAPRVLVGGSP
jgi:hypothetical protein